MRSTIEITDAYELLDGVLTGKLDLGDVPEDIGLMLSATADALGWVMEQPEALLGVNLTHLRLGLLTHHVHDHERD